MCFDCRLSFMAGYLKPSPVNTYKHTYIRTFPDDLLRWNRSRFFRLCWNLYIYKYIYTYIMYIYYTYIYVGVSRLFFVCANLLIVHIWNSSPPRSNLHRLQYICCTVPKTSGRLHETPLVWACLWLSSKPPSSPQVSHNDSLWDSEKTKVTGSKVWTLGRLWNCLDSHLGQIVCDKDGVVDLIHCPGGNDTD